MIPLDSPSPPPKFVSPHRLARFYFLECERYLRYSSTPKAARGEEAVPEMPWTNQPVTEAILEGGYAWEEEVVESLGKVVRIADGEDKTPVRDRQYSADEAKDQIATLVPGEYLYQPTLVPPAGLYQRYGIDPSVVRMTECRPDLIRCLATSDGELELQVVDVKASPGVKLAHRVQVTVYSLILKSLLDEWGIRDRVVSETAAVWLSKRDEPDPFDIRSMRPPIERFFEEDMQELLARPADDARWHLYYRCEWCEFFQHCSDDMHATDDVSRVPYLSGRAKDFMRRLDPPVRSVGDLRDLLADEGRSSELDDCASLGGRQRRLARQVEALTQDRIETFGGHTAAMPRAEHVRILLTLQNEPVSGQIYAWGMYAQGVRDLASSSPLLETRVAASGDPDAVAALERDFVHEVHGLLRAAHDFNSAESEWKAQKTLQAYVFDGYERSLLMDLLLRRVEDPDVAAEALALLFHFQQADLLEAADHPADVVVYPVVDLMRVLRSLFALPVEVTYRFADAARLLQPAERAFEYRGSDYFSFPFSNQMRSDAIFAAWYRGEDRTESIQRELQFRLWGTNSLVNGIRERLDGEDALFAWPPKFKLPASFDYRHPTLSRLAFLARYESVLGYLGVREPRLAPEADREESGYVLRLRYLGDEWFELAVEHGEATLEESTFSNWLLARDDRQGHKALLTYDDYRQRRAAYHLPGNSPLHLAAVLEVNDQAKPPRLRIKATAGGDAAALAEGAGYLLTPRFTDFLSDRAIEEIGAVDAAEDPEFVSLVETPHEFGEVSPPEEVRSTALELARTHGMTASQIEAFEGMLDGRLRLVWGPPGTGKTHFLGLATLCLAEAHRRMGGEWHVLVSSFTHTAIDNCLRKIAEIQANHEILSGELPIAKLGTRVLANMDRVAEVPPEEAWTWATRSPISIVGGTVWSVRKGIEPEIVDLVVIDEGSQMKLPEAAIAARRLAPDGRLVIAGDDRQLPPIVLGSYPAPAEGEPLLHRSIFEALRERDGADTYTTLLLENFRMNRTLCRYPALQLYTADYDSANEAIAERRISLAEGPTGSEFVEAVLDPDHPLAVVTVEGLQAAAENRFEASLVAELAGVLRERLADERGAPYPDDVSGDEAFWEEGLFVVSPHHAQIRAIRSALAERRDWHSEPFVGTVDRMQGQECDAVITSYGVSDPEYAISEKEFIYSLNRLNVAITRGRAKTIVFLSVPLLEPPISAFEDDETAEGIGFMQGLVRHAAQEGADSSFELEGDVQLRLLAVGHSPNQLP